MNDLKPVVSSGRKFSAIWIIPLLAFAIGVYMVIHTMMTEGPEITIVFKSAEGLEAGKTKIRYRNVNIGLVEDVTLSQERDSIVVTAKMELEAKPMLREDTRFWVVRPRVGAGGITGLGTILSGAYIELDPGDGATHQHKFTGLEVPPLTPGDAPGLRLTLHSESAGSVSAGDAILYNGYKVGRIEAVKLDSDKKKVFYNVFIDAPYDDLVTTNSRFWNISGFDIEASAAGIQVKTGSLETILLGGIAFGALPGLPPGQKAESGASYKLNPSYFEVVNDPYQQRVYYVTEFNQSVRGLEPGAPVEYRGILIGQVERILLKELTTDKRTGTPIPVLFYVEPGRMGRSDTAENAATLRNTVATGIASGGMRTSLETGNLLTGKKIITIDIHADAEPVTAGEFDGYPVMPSIATGLGRLEHQISSLLGKLNELPLDTTVARANTALATMDGTLASLTDTLGTVRGLLEEDSTQQLTAELNATLAKLNETLGGLAPGSPAGQSLNSSIYELNRLLRNLRQLTRTLSDKPNAVIFPTDTPADPIPEARAQ